MIKQRPFCDQRASMKTNVLLQRHKVGRHTPSTYDLPPDDFAYGEMKHDNYGVKDIFEGFKVRPPPASARSGRSKRAIPAQRDFVATNKAALKAGCVSAREFDEFRGTHMITKKPEVNLVAQSDDDFKIMTRNMVHGVQNHIVHEMKQCLEYQYGRDAVEQARKRQELRQKRLQSPQLNKGKMHQRALLATRATRGESVKPQVAPTHADNFKMKRFLAIDHYAINDKW